MIRRTVVVGLVISLGMGLTSCPYSPPTRTPGKGVSMGLGMVAQGLNRPLFLTAPPGEEGRLFIVEQGGKILLRKGDTLLDTPFLDLSTLIGSGTGERGLLGMAFHPDYPNNGQFYVNYTDHANNTVVALYCAYADDPDRGNPATAVILLTIAQPFSNHNGGMLAFGADGYLYIGLGDGGSGDDPDNHAQRLDTLLGKILRIDVDSEAPYAIPPDNPFIQDEAARDEIWAFGLRNPWRFSFDRQTGDLWIGDVGQNAREEINFQPASSAGGENYGWRIREGELCRPGGTECDLLGAVDPLHTYFNRGSQSITGGYVYRGSAMPELTGTYFFADFISGKVYALTQEEEVGFVVVDETAVLNAGDIRLSNVASFGEDGQGELYIVDHGAGAVYKIVAL